MRRRYARTVLHNLLRERDSIRDLVTILEALADIGVSTRDVNILTEHVRQALARTICKANVNEKAELYLMTLSPEIWQVLGKAVTRTGACSHLAIEPKLAQQIIARIRKTLETTMPTTSAVLLCAPSIRFHLKRLTEKFIPHLAVLSHNEIPAHVNVISVGVVT